MQFPFTLEQVQTFTMIFIRTGSILFSIPIFGSENIPRTSKVGLALALSWIIFPAVPIAGELQSLSLIQLIPVIVAEIMIGIIIGFIGRLIFEGIQLGGQLTGFQMGFGIVNVMDPLTGANFSIIAQFQNLLAILLFITLNLHQVFFQAIAMSFVKIPIFHCYLSDQLFEWVIGLSSNIFIIAVKVAAPVMAANLFVTVTLGIMNKAVQQMNVMIVGFPLKIAVGLLAIGLTMPVFGLVVKKNFSHMGEYINVVLNAGYLP